MKVIIAGSREWTNYLVVKELIESYELNISEVVSGGSRGVDKLGERWANENSIKIKIFKANWDKFGKMAGPIRNNEMAEYADFLIAFLDYTKCIGTQNMIKTMHNVGKPYVVQLLREKNNGHEQISEGSGKDFNLPKT